MKKLANISALLFAVVIIATGCKKLPEFTDGNSSGGNTPTTGGTLSYHLNEEPSIGPDFISIYAKYTSENEITGMILQVCEDATMSYNVISNTIEINASEITGIVTGLQPSTHYYWCILYTELGLKYMTDPVEFTTLESETIPLEPSDTINFDGKNVVLLENYTGVRCTNSNIADDILYNLKNYYSDHLVVLSVHPNAALQNPNGGFPDFRTEEGSEWNEYFGIEAYPLGLVNRQEVLYTENWSEAIANIINNDALVRLIIKSKYNDDTRELKLSIYSKFLQDIMSDDIHLTVCIIENNIIGKQVTPEGIVDNYIHRYVFRGTTDNLSWGRSLGNTITAGTNVITNMQFALDENYNADEVTIVAFITNDTNKQVLMAAEKRIK